ncbi:MAG: hypothetical protein WC477_01165 [Patescibacteria group bacterium]
MPSVSFSVVPLYLEVEWMHGFLFYNKWGWDKYILKKHPALKDAYIYKKKKDQIIFIQNYILNYRKANKLHIQNRISLYKKLWRKKETAYFKLLCEILETDWSKQHKTIKAFISINPICPRFLDLWSFFLFFNYIKPSSSIETIMHETCHFLYFKKWKEVFKHSKKNTFESPYIEWHLSELVAPIILNDPKIQTLLKGKASFYAEHEVIKIKGMTAPAYFTKLYQKRKSFDSFLISSYREIRKYKKYFPV